MLDNTSDEDNVGPATTAADSDSDSGDLDNESNRSRPSSPAMQRLRDLSESPPASSPLYRGSRSRPATSTSAGQSNGRLPWWRSKGAGSSAATERHPRSAVGPTSQHNDLRRRKPMAPPSMVGREWWRSSAPSTRLRTDGGGRRVGDEERIFGRSAPTAPSSVLLTPRAEPVRGRPNGGGWWSQQKPTASAGTGFGRSSAGSFGGATTGRLQNRNRNKDHHQQPHSSDPANSLSQHSFQRHPAVVQSNHLARLASALSSAEKAMSHLRYPSSTASNMQRSQPLTASLGSGALDKAPFTPRPSFGLESSASDFARSGRGEDPASGSARKALNGLYQQQKAEADANLALSGPRHNDARHSQQQLALAHRPSSGGVGAGPAATHLAAVSAAVLKLPSAPAYAEVAAQSASKAQLPPTSSVPLQISNPRLRGPARSVFEVPEAPEAGQSPFMRVPRRREAGSTWPGQRTAGIKPSSAINESSQRGDPDRPIPLSGRLTRIAARETHKSTPPARHPVVQRTQPTAQVGPTRSRDSSPAQSPQDSKAERRMKVEDLERESHEQNDEKRTHCAQPGSLLEAAEAPAESRVHGNQPIQPSEGAGVMAASQDLLPSKRLATPLDRVQVSKAGAQPASQPGVYIGHDQDAREPNTNVNSNESNTTSVSTSSSSADAAALDEAAAIAAAADAEESLDATASFDGTADQPLPTTTAGPGSPGRRLSKIRDDLLDNSMEPDGGAPNRPNNSHNGPTNSHGSDLKARTGPRGLPSTFNGPGSRGRHLSSIRENLVYDGTGSSDFDSQKPASTTHIPDSSANGPGSLGRHLGSVRDDLVDHSANFNNRDAKSENLRANSSNSKEANESVELGEPHAGSDGSDSDGEELSFMEQRRRILLGIRETGDGNDDHGLPVVLPDDSVEMESGSHDFVYVFEFSSLLRSLVLWLSVAMP